MKFIAAKEDLKIRSWWLFLSSDTEIDSSESSKDGYERWKSSLDMQPPCQPARQPGCPSPRLSSILTLATMIHKKMELKIKTANAQNNSHFSTQSLYMKWNFFKLLSPFFLRNVSSHNFCVRLKSEILIQAASFFHSHSFSSTALPPPPHMHSQLVGG